MLNSCFRAYLLFASTHGSQSAPKKYHVIGNTRSWLVDQLLAFFSLIAKIRKMYLQNWVISTQNEYTNYFSHFKYKQGWRIRGFECAWAPPEHHLLAKAPLKNTRKMVMHTIVKLNYMLKVAEGGIFYHYAVILFITLWLATIPRIRRRNLKSAGRKSTPWCFDNSPPMNIKFV